MEELDLMDPELLSERNRMNALSGWDKETDRSARTANARAAKLQKLAREIDPEGLLSAQELAARIKTRQKLRRAQRRYEKKLSEHRNKVAGPSVAAGGPAGETTTTQAASTGQESR